MHGGDERITGSLRNDVGHALCKLENGRMAPGCKGKVTGKGRIRVLTEADIGCTLMCKWSQCEMCENCG